MKEVKTCKMESCNEFAKINDWCLKHYKLIKKSNKKEHEKKFQKNQRKLPINQQSWKKTYRKRQKKCFELLGNKCQICGEIPDFNLKIINLQFHHITYPNGSMLINEEGKRRYGSTRLFKEVEQNPKNFKLLCKDCHIRFWVIYET